MSGRWIGVAGLAAMALCAVTVRSLVEPRTVISGSMEPTYQIGDRVLVDKVTYHLRAPRRGEVVLFLREGERAPMVKRVLGLPGEWIEVADGVVRVDGDAVPEAYLAERPTYRWGPSQVPPGHLFVLGDNRDASADSHVWGYLPVQAVRGRVTARFWRQQELLQLL